MRKLILGSLLAACMAGSANAATIVVDGVLDSAYGAKTASVGYDNSTGISNFSLPTPVAHDAGYDIYLNSSDGYVYGYLDYTAGTAIQPTFANLYFDTVKAGGSTLGFELGAANHANAFIPGGSGPVAVSGVTTATTANGSLEFAIPVSLFETPVAGLTYSPNTFPHAGSLITLRISQSLGYTAAGGSTYGPTRLGTFALSAAPVSGAPEPSTWLLMIGGLGLVGALLRTRRRAATVAA
jgi:hypothetical protein